jgi:tetratricopeptide (TPR) repeat protein
VSSDDPLAEEIDHESAAVLHAEAARQGLPGAAVRYGETLFFLGDHATAEHVLREALARGDEGAHDWLSDVLVATDRPAEAALLMEEHPDRALRAAAIWAQAVDDRERAEKWYRKAVKDDEPGALNDYGSFLSEDDARLEEAEQHFKESIAAGWLSAVYAYAEMLRQEGRGAEVAALAADAERLGAAPDRLRELTG